MRRLLAGAIDLQIGHNHMAFAIQREVNERVWHEHPHRIEHIRIMLTVGDH